MKVLFLTHNFQRHSGDAPGSFILRLSSALRNDGIETSVREAFNLDLARPRMLLEQRCGSPPPTVSIRR